MPLAVGWPPVASFYTVWGVIDCPARNILLNIFCQRVPMLPVQTEGDNGHQ
jgi:hypothetical protein